MKTQLKNGLLLFFAILIMVSFKGLTTTKNKLKEQQHQEILDILSEEESYNTSHDEKIFENKVIVLDSYGNTLLNKSFSDVENEKLSKEEQLILMSSDFLMDNLGNRVLIQY